MKNDGFTIVELLGVITILGLVLGMVVTGYVKITEAIKLSFYKGLEESIMMASGEYYSHNEEKAPEMFGSAVKVDVRELIDGGYIEEVLDRNKKLCDTKVNESYAIAYKDSYDKTKYSVCLICSKDDYQSNCSLEEDYTLKMTATKETSKKNYQEGTWTNENIILNFKSQNDIKTVEVTGGGETKSCTLEKKNGINQCSITIDKNGTYIATGKGESGKTTESKSIEIMIDKQAPTFSMEKAGPEEIDFQEEDQTTVEINNKIININDNLSGIGEILYSLEKEGTKENYLSENPEQTEVILEDEIGKGKWILKIEIKDKAGNSTKKEVEYFVNNKVSYTVNHYTKNLGNTAYTLNSTEKLQGKEKDVITIQNLKKTIAGFTYVDAYLTGNTTKPTSGAITTATIPAEDDNLQINLYYRRNRLYVQYHGNGGTFNGSSTCKSVNGLAECNGNTNFLRGLYGSYVGGVTESTGVIDSNGLHDYNNKDAISFTRSGYIVSDSGQWNTASNGNGTSYTQYTSTYEATAMATAGGKNLSNGDATITLYVNWVLDTKKATIPTAANYCSNPSYNGSSQTIVKAAGTGYTWTAGTTTRTNVGNQNVTATLNSGYVWSDNSTGTKTISCGISKATPTITLSPTSGTVQKGNTMTFNEKANIKGKFTVNSGNTSIATVTQASSNEIAANTNNLVTVKGIEGGTSTITVSFTPTDTTNYKNASKTYTANVQVIPTLSFSRSGKTVTVKCTASDGIKSFTIAGSAVTVSGTTKSTTHSLGTCSSSSNSGKSKSVSATCVSNSNGSKTASSSSYKCSRNSACGVASTTTTWSGLCVCVGGSNPGPGAMTSYRCSNYAKACKSICSSKGQSYYSGTCSSKTSTTYKYCWH